MVVFALEPMKFPGQWVLGFLSQEAWKPECEFDHFPLSCTKLYFHVSSIMEAGQLIQYSDWATGWTIEELRYHFQWGQSIFLFSREPPDQFWGPSNLLFSGYQELFPSSFFSLWHCDPTWVMASSFMRFLDHTRCTTVGRTPLDE